MPEYLNTASDRIFPTREMKAIDMAEVIRAAVIEDGIIQGCRLTNSGGKIWMDPGRVLIHGRLGLFEPHPEYVDPQSGTTVNAGSEDTETSICIKSPPASEYSGWSKDAERFICVVYDPRRADTLDQMYIKMLAKSTITTMQALEMFDSEHTQNYDANFNARDYGAVIKIAKVMISHTDGSAYDLDVNTVTYSYGLKSNKSLFTNEINNFKTRENNRFDLLKKRDSALATANGDSYPARHQLAFFRNSTVTLDGIVINATSSVTLTFRRELGSKVLLYDEDKTKPAAPTGDNAKNGWIILKRTKAGAFTVDSESACVDPRIEPNDSAKETVQGQTFYKALNAPMIHRGIVGIRISNASGDGGKGSANCVLQSYWSDIYSNSNWATLDWRGHIYVMIRNLGSSAAKIKLEVTSLYVRNTDYNYPTS